MKKINIEKISIDKLYKHLNTSYEGLSDNEANVRLNNLIELNELLLQESEEILIQDLLKDTKSINKSINKLITIILAYICII